MIRKKDAVNAIVWTILLGMFGVVCWTRFDRERQFDEMKARLEGIDPKCLAGTGEK